MDRRRKERLLAMLKDARAEQGARCRALRVELTEQNGGMTENFVDGAQRSTIEDPLTVQLNLATARLSEINEALIRLARDTYGQCHCGKPIPEKRLRALPTAQRCLECQQALEVGTHRNAPSRLYAE